MPLNLGYDITVKTADKCKESTTKCVGMLKKWSSKWECYIDVTRISEIDEGDHLTVIAENAEKSTSSSHEQVRMVNLYVEYTCSHVILWCICLCIGINFKSHFTLFTCW